MATSRVVCGIFSRYRQATCLQTTVNHQAYRLLFTRHVAPWMVPVSHPTSTHRCCYPIQSRCVSQDNTPKPEKEPIATVTGLPLVDEKKGILVYDGPITKNIKLVKIFSLSTSGIALVLLPFVLPDIVKLPAVLQFMLGSGVSFFMLGTPLIIHALTKRYVTDLYYNKDSSTFTVTTLTFFCRQKVREFTQEDVTFPNLTTMFCFLKVKGAPLMFFPSNFRSKEGYIKLMGYDKPMDFSDIEGFGESPEKKDEK
ncbi:transmembrane protein 70 homolog, mitochondrial-like [Ylistrum balloti]|uniref:transmembrane protein 70 homolog, mitochondrial-like n=1 Tax=Ylistrum balloti TaxID=509963 RepID=UPI002905A13C|nr:transmembrane protein 70 homolog, mitochondrial-like [Ylistrum balloti]